MWPGRNSCAVVSVIGSLSKKMRPHRPLPLYSIDAEGERTVLYSTNGYLPYAPEGVDEQNRYIAHTQLLLVDGHDVDTNLHLLRPTRKYNLKSVLDLEHSGKPKLIDRIS